MTKNKPPARIGGKVSTNVYWLDEGLIMASSERRAADIVRGLNRIAETDAVTAQGIVNAIRRATDAIEYLALYPAAPATPEPRREIERREP